MSSPGIEQFILRLPLGMRDRIRQAADANRRSMNAEIVTTLANTYPEPVDALAQTWEHLERLARQVRDGHVVLPLPSGAREGGADQDAVQLDGGVPELLDQLSRLARGAPEDGAMSS